MASESNRTYENGDSVTLSTEFEVVEEFDKDGETYVEVFRNGSYVTVPKGDVDG